jgi:hypothetical protein
MFDLIAQDVNGNSRTDCGREGMDYWHLLVLASVRLGCNLTYDQLHELSENHITLRAIMGIGLWDEGTEFKWRRIRDNVYLLTPETIDRISQLIIPRSCGDRAPDSLTESCRVLWADSSASPSHIWMGASSCAARCRRTSDRFSPASRRPLKNKRHAHAGQRRDNA